MHVSDDFVDIDASTYMCMNISVYVFVDNFTNIKYLAYHSLMDFKASSFVKQLAFEACAGRD